MSQLNTTFMRKLLIDVITIARSYNGKLVTDLRIIMGPIFAPSRTRSDPKGANVMTLRMFPRGCFKISKISI